MPPVPVLPAAAQEVSPPCGADVTVTDSPAKSLEEQALTVIPAAAPDTGLQDAAPGGRKPWRTAGIGLTSLGTPIGIGVADPIIGTIAFAVELAVALTVIGTALFGSTALSERAFRLLRWIGNRPEPPAPAAPDCSPAAR